jgi:aminomethyltransferase
LKKTPLNAEHRATGARMVEFGGWDMPSSTPASPTSISPCATRAGLFDVSHMGQIELAGADAWRRPVDDAATTPRVRDRPVSVLRLYHLRPGTFVDDVLVYRMADEHYLLVVNAGNIVEGPRVESLARRSSGRRRSRGQLELASMR